MADYTLEQVENRLLVTPAGDLTAVLVPGLQRAIRDALVPDVEELVVDLRHAAMLDSSGMSLLIAAANTLARRNGRLRVVEVSPDLFQLLQSMRLVARLNVAVRTS